MSICDDLSCNSMGIAVCEGLLRDLLQSVEPWEQSPAKSHCEIISDGSNYLSRNLTEPAAES